MQTLREPGQLTLLAPTDTAFRQLKPGQLDRLLRGNPKCLESELPPLRCSALLYADPPTLACTQVLAQMIIETQRETEIQTDK